MGGSLRGTPQDFQVEELPAYPPCGEGEHLFVDVEKTDLSTPEVARSLATALGIAERAVSYAGLKDRRAVSRQTLCVPSRFEDRLRAVDLPNVRILGWKRHRNKLRTGHLKGNQFRIRVRGISDAEAGRAVLERLRTLGVANYFGPQRFGTEGKNAPAGKALLQTPPSAPAPGRTGAGGRARGDRFRRKLYLSAYQSLLFNRALAERIRGGEFGRALRGDVMRRLDSGGLFLCEDPAIDQPRVDRFEISPSGPLFGPKMMPAGAEVARSEERLLEDEEMSLDDFRRGGGETEGGRRAYRLPLPDCFLTAEGPDAWIEFQLPKGTYATALLREVIGREVR